MIKKKGMKKETFKAGKMLALVVVIVMIITSVAFADDLLLPIQFERQEDGMWCNCAAVTMVLNRYLTNYPEWPTDTDTDACTDLGQCAVANREYGSVPDNCPSPDNGGTDYGITCEWHPHAEDQLDDWGVSANEEDTDISYSDYQDEIDDGKPVLIHFGCLGHHSHTVVGVGYNDDSVSEMYIMNPSRTAAYGGLTLALYSDVVNGRNWIDACPDTDCGGDQPWYDTVTIDNAPSGETIRLRCSTAGETVSDTDFTSDYLYKTTSTGSSITAGDDDGHEFEVTEGTTVFESPLIYLKKGFETGNAVSDGVEFRATYTPAP